MLRLGLPASRARLVFAAAAQDLRAHAIAPPRGIGMRCGRARRARPGTESLPERMASSSAQPTSLCEHPAEAQSLCCWPFDTGPFATTALRDRYGVAVTNPPG